MNELLFDMSIPVSDSAHVDAARRQIVRAAAELNNDDTLLGKLTVVVQEAARNLVNHAGSGELLYCQDSQALRLLTVDSGPGMANVAQCLTDSYSTTGTMGAGLGAMQRMSDLFDVFSQPGQGTVLYTQFDLPHAVASLDPGFSVGAVCTPYPGEEICGDAWAMRGNRVMIADGLGHGHAASVASQKARQVFLDHDPALTIEQVMEQMHRALMPTRGGAVSIAEINVEQRQLRFCGMGNVAGILVSDKQRSLVSSNGTVGYRMGRIHGFSYPWEPGNVLLLASDGIGTKLNLGAYPGLYGRHPAVIAGLVHRDFKRHNDDATVVVVKYDTPRH
ncbi:SpoIIE family protein phosphatase [Pseudomonas sp. HR96]|uniref:SpoIIE family protein phosphatase n=1 Tax=Pseudomonas sp. HR96 TaxID=1027966 RepID=UPI002A7498E5|nr:SpoIIE family protein phosphatase [Pseudomonas sp. HR96]WPO98010.1 SpoIIE family protein phosphatase [Pseudomonas sp. HR96]